MGNKSSVTKLSHNNFSSINLIWKTLKRPQDIDDDDTWPFVHIKDYQTTLVPTSASDAGYIPISIVNFLEYDFCYYPTEIERIDHLGFYLSDDLITSLYQFWKRIL